MMILLAACLLADPVPVYIIAGQSNAEGYGVPHAPLETIDEVTVVWPGRSQGENAGPLRTGWGANEKMIGPEYGFGQEMQRHHQSPVVLLKTAWGGKDVWCDFRSPSTGDFNWAERQMKAREEREGRSREVGSFFRAMINNVKTGLNQARVHLGREDLELKGLVWFQGWNDYCQWPVEEAGSPCGRGIIERYSHNLKHMLVDLREALDATTLPIVIGELGVHGTEVPKSRSGWALRAFRTAQAETASQLDHCCFAPTAAFWDAHATDHWECHYNGSAESYLRMGRTFALHLLALDALPKGQVMRWQASQEGMQTMLHHYPPEAGGLALWGSSIFRLWERAPAHFSEHNVTNLAFGGARSWEALHYANETLFPMQPSTILYYCGSNDVNAGEDAAGIAERFRLFSELTRDRLPDTDIFFGAINRSPEKKERWAVVDEANQRVASYCETQDGRTFVDLNQVLEADDGSTRQDMFLPDQLHLTERAYEGFARVMREALEQQVQSP